jgi:hypothetical protein
MSHINTCCTWCNLIEVGRLKFIEYGFVKTIAGLLESERLSIELQETILDLFANLAETGFFEFYCSLFTGSIVALLFTVHGSLVAILFCVIVYLLSKV